MEWTDPCLKIPIDEAFAVELVEAAFRFNREFLFRCGPEVGVRNGCLVIHPHDVADYLSFVNRRMDNELALFRIKREVERRVRGLPTEETLLFCLRNIRWNEPAIYQE